MGAVLDSDKPKPPPAPPPPPEPPKEVDPGIRRARVFARKRAVAAAGGRQSSILTGPRGLTSEQSERTPGSKVLLGR